MTVDTILMLLVAGVLGGLANSMAGGASLVTYPAMMAAGLMPIAANASNTFGLIPGNLIGAWSERDKLPPVTVATLAVWAASLVGGAAGAVLLLYTPEKFFVQIVPALIGLATLIFALSKPIQVALASHFGSENQSLRATLVFPAAVYGGYFGAGVGVLFMAVLSATSHGDLRTANAMKNSLGVLANAAAIIIFLANGLIHWPETLTMMAACIIGGTLGSQALRIISPKTMRRFIIATGTVMTVFYAWKYWL